MAQDIEFTYSISTNDMKLRAKVTSIEVLNAGNGNFWVAGDRKGPCSSTLDTNKPMQFSHFANEDGVETAMLLNISDKRLTPVITL